MFKTREEMTVDQKFAIILHNAISVDPDTGNWLYRSYGRRRAGRKTRYFFDGHHITAETDDEAIAKANRMIAKQKVVA